jgi:proteasome lid subunit RPN8/RPN11
VSAAVELRPAHFTRQEIRSSGVSFVATKTATVRSEYGNDELLKAGVTYVHNARHFLVTEYPHLFARVGAGTRAKRTVAPNRRSAAPAPEPKRPMWTPLVRINLAAPATFTVHIADRAYVDMGTQAFGQRGTLETGGPLFGIPSNGDTLKVRRAGEPGPKARASEGSYHPDLEHTRRQAIDLQRRDAIDRWVGSWHTHPSGDGQPSRGDLRFFAWDCREWHHMGRSIDNYVALILTPNWAQDRSTFESYLSWAKPTFKAWHMQAVSDDQFICTPAKVERC